MVDTLIAVHTSPAPSGASKDKNGSADSITLAAAPTVAESIKAAATGLKDLLTGASKGDGSATPALIIPDNALVTNGRKAAGKSIITYRVIELV